MPPSSGTGYSHPIVARRLPGRLSSLLVTLLLLLLLSPFLEGFVIARVMLTALFTATLVSALYCVTRPAWVLKLGLALIVPAIALSWAPYAAASPLLDVGRYVFTMLAFAFTAVVIVVHTLRATRVSVDQIAGVLSAYLLLGLVWGFAYFLLESAAPGSLSIDAASEEARLSESIYYSFVTLTTLGYGDILPLSERARALAYVEAIIGQFYLAVLLARLVGMYVVASTTESD